MEPENIGQINRRALFCDENGDFRIPPEPEQNDQVKIKFRTGRMMWMPSSIYKKAGRGRYP